MQNINKALISVNKVLLLLFIFFVLVNLASCSKNNPAPSSNTQTIDPTSINWSQTGQGIITSTSPITAITGTANSVFVATTNGVFHSSDNGKTWSSANTGLPNPSTSYVNAIVISGNNIFAGSASAGVFRSSNNGTNWTSVNSNPTSCIAANGSNIFAGGAGIIMSSDNGQSWTPINTGLPNIGTDTTASIQSLAFSGSNIFAVTFDYPGGGVYFLPNNGSSWKSVNIGLTGASSTSIAANSTNIFVGGLNGIFLSTSQGTSWTQILLVSGIYSISISGSNIFAGTSSAVYFSNNSGQSWTTVNAGLPSGNFSVEKLGIAGNNIYAGTTNGLYMSPL